MLIAMAGLPGTGKSTLAACLAERLGAVVLDKDRVRAALFPPGVLDYSAAQDGIAMAAVYQAAAAILRADPRQAVILDGRTFLRAGQLDDLLTLAASLNERVRVIECVCDDALARERLERDLAKAAHPAGNRTFALYRSLKAAAEPIPIPHLVLDTGRLSPEECVARGLEYLGATGRLAGPRKERRRGSSGGGQGPP
jgi:predicted kinase